jgi:hypothetical protein
VTGLKRDARRRRRAQSAVRAMDKLQQELRDAATKDDGKEEEEEDNDEDEDTTSNATSSKMTTKEDDEDESEPIMSASGSDTGHPVTSEGDWTTPNTKKQGGLQDSLSPAPNTETSRSGRARRSPALYNPQTCAASSWRSDGVTEWKYLSPAATAAAAPNKDSHDEPKKPDEPSSPKPSPPKPPPAKDEPEPNTTPILKTPTSQKERKEPKSSDVFCKFCLDDKAVPICCFCACRVCFGKYNPVRSTPSLHSFFQTAPVYCMFVFPETHIIYYSCLGKYSTV